MYILGISAFYHDSAAVLLKNGVVLSAVEEERFSRIKHDNQFPFAAINFCLKDAKITIDQIEAVAYYEKPLLKFERILANFVETYPFSLFAFIKGIPEWFGDKIKIEQIIKKKLKFKGKIFFIPHHLSHAASAFFSSGFDEAAILTVDGVGEYQTTCLWQGKNNNITLLKSMNFPNSLGLLYSTFTAFLGFKVNEDEYKVMGMAAYGKPILVDKIYKLLSFKDDGSFNLDMSYFGFRYGLQMWNIKFVKLFGLPRKSNEAITQFHKNLATSIQKVTEDVYFLMLNHLYSLVPIPQVAISGGVALNALANGKIYSNTHFTDVYIFGPAGDNGAALGAALLVYNQICKPVVNKQFQSLFLGSEYGNTKIKETLKIKNLTYQQFASEELLIDTIARLLNEGKIIGWFQDRMEFGPRALGARSILAKPTPANVKDKVNQIKKREQFRPFGGSILKQYVNDYFEIPVSQYDFPFMNFCFKVKSDKRNVLAAIVHADNTCRIQTVTEKDSRYYKLLNKFYEISGIPCLLNTSFNLAGEPLVESPAQAIDDFLKVPMDYLAIGNFLIHK